MKQIFSKLLIVVLIFAGNLNADEPVIGINGMVVTASDLATDVGLEILMRGGNAVDASVAVGFAMAVTYPYAGNLGGGGFMVIRFSSGDATAIDFRETAPAAAHPEMYLDENGEYIPALSQEGMTSSGIPGTVAGLIYVLEEYGTMSLEEVIEPAIRLAESGFPISYEMAESINYYNEQFNRYESSKKIFTNNGEKLQPGDFLLQEDLAETLYRIRDKGLDGFYKGKTAELIVHQSDKYGGYITYEDLINYKVREKDPVYGSYKDYEIISMPPPSSGGIAIIQAFNILENYNFSKEDWGSSRYIHTLAEIFKYVYADRSKHLGDDDFYPVPVEWLTSKEYADEIFQKIANHAVSSDSISAGTAFKKEDHETTHFSIIDIDGNAVSCTYTLNSAYGNKIVVDGAGFLMNNEMDDFSSQPGEPNLYGLIGSEANKIEAGKRMLSSMTPTIVTKNDKPFMITGAAGGSRIITSVFQSICNIILFNMNLDQAIHIPMIHHQWLPDRIDYEEFALSLDVKKNLEKMGHKIGVEKLIGRLNSIYIDPESGLYYGAASSRTNGKAVGY